MPWGSWINDLPTGFFLVVHVAAFALAAGFAWAAFMRELSLLGLAFSLFAAAELCYLTYHLDWTVFLFAHTISEVLDLAAFVLVFLAAVVPVFELRRFSAAQRGRFPPSIQLVMVARCSTRAFGPGSRRSRSPRSCSGSGRPEEVLPCRL